jgi:hypothetical protein
MEISLQENGSITVEGEHYEAWPYFKVTGVDYLRGRLNCKHLKWLIQAEDLWCSAWQQYVPTEVLHELRRYPDGHAELMELAQIDPLRFVEMSRSNPALTYLVAAYWSIFTWQRMPKLDERNCRRTELLLSKRRLILKNLGLPERNEWVRILGKIPARHCHDFHIRNIIALCTEKQIFRRLRHLSTITMDVSWLLRMEYPVLDTALLQIAGAEPEHKGLRLTDLVSSMVNKREMAVRKPYWPFGNSIRSWDQLLRAERRNARRCGHLSDQFPPPPIPLDNLPEGLAMTPLSTAQMVHDEANDMGNCVADYLQQIQCGERYLYRMEAPVRASVLLRRARFYWELEEIGLRDNEGDLDDDIRWLVVRWMRANYEHHKLGN